MSGKIGKQLWNRAVLPLVVVALLLMVLWSAGTAGANSPYNPSVMESVPALLNYQGVVEVSDLPYDGTGYFKFAIVDTANGDGTTSYWANDGTSSGEPAASVSLAVGDGLFNVLLGDTSITGMSQPVDEACFASDR